MTHPYSKKVLAALVALALPGALLAQQQGQQQKQPSSQQAQQPKAGQSTLGQVRASRLKDMKVVDTQGKEIGEISEIVVDMRSGRLHAAVLEFGGFMGMGEKQFAFTPTQLRAGKGDDRVVLDVDKQKLQSAQGFAKNQWPAMGDEYWGRVGREDGTSTRRDSGVPPKRSLVRVGEIIGKDVQDKQGEDVGEVQEIILDLNQGRIRSVVLELDDGGRATVQPRALSMGSEGDKLVTSQSAAQLRQQAQRARGGSGASAGGSRIPGNGDVGVFGPTAKDRSPTGGAEMGTVPGRQPGTDRPERAGK